MISAVAIYLPTPTRPIAPVHPGADGPQPPMGRRLMNPLPTDPRLDSDLSPLAGIALLHPTVRVPQPVVDLLG